MKEAKSEAEKIIAAYKAEMEANYQSKLSMVRLIFVLFIIRVALQACQV